MKQHSHKRHLCFSLQAVAAIALLWLGVAFSVGAQVPQKEKRPTQESFQEISRVVQKMIQNREIAGAVVMVSHQNETAYFRAEGMRDVEEKLPMEKDTIFRIYSMTKPVTTVAAMMLYEQGKIKLDDPIEKYVPEFKGIQVYNNGKPRAPKTKITVRQLMNHTAGFTYGFSGKTPVDKMYKEDHPIFSRSNKEFVRKLVKHPLLHEPGTIWHYSVATDILGALVERVSGESLGDYFQENIFAPLQMNDTAFYINDDKVHRLASVYGKNLILKEKNKHSHYRSRERAESGGGGLLSTASDYMVFCKMLLGNGLYNKVRLLKEESIKEMTKNQLPPNVKAYQHFGFGLGFLIQLEDWGIKGHVGEYGWNGIAGTHFWISPQDDLIVIALSQRRPFSTKLKDRLKPVVYEALR